MVTFVLLNLLSKGTVLCFYFLSHSSLFFAQKDLTAPPGCIYPHSPRFTSDSLLCPISPLLLTPRLLAPEQRSSPQAPGNEPTSVRSVPTECSQEPDEHFSARCAPCTTCCRLCRCRAVSERLEEGIKQVTTRGEERIMPPKVSLK